MPRRGWLIPFPPIRITALTIFRRKTEDGFFLLHSAGNWILLLKVFLVLDRAYLGARYYSSTGGRFMTPDWDVRPVAVPYATYGDPQSLNLYIYVENSPLNRIDADGHFRPPQAGKGKVNVPAADCSTTPAGAGESAGKGNCTAPSSTAPTVCGNNSNCIGIGYHFDTQDPDYTASTNVLFLKAEEIGIGGKISGGIVDTTINTTSYSVGENPGQGTGATGQVNIQGAAGNAEASAKIAPNGTQLKLGAEAVLFKAGGTLNLHMGSFTVQLSGSYQFGAAAKVGGSSTYGPNGLNSLGGSVSAAAGPLGAAFGLKLGSTSALSSQEQQ